MKKHNFNNLFVRGGKIATIAFMLAPMVAYGKDNNPYGDVNNTGLVGLACVIGVLAAPAIIEKVKQNRRDKQR